MHTILLSIGSNTYSKTNIDKAKRMIRKSIGEYMCTDELLSTAVEEPYRFPFRNILMMIHTDLPIDFIIKTIKRIEQSIGRRPHDKQMGKVLIDIDLLRVDDIVLRQEDFNSDYVQTLLTYPFLMPKQ